MVSDSSLNTVLNLMKGRVPLSQVVKQDVALQKKGREFVGHCPFHNEKTGSFFVNDDKGTFYCFGCGVSGDIIEYLMKKRGIQFKQALEVLSEISGIRIPDSLDKGSNEIGIQQKILQELMKFFQKELLLSPDAQSYCERRGITKDLIEKFSIGYSPKYDAKLLQYLRGFKFSTTDIIKSGVFIEKKGRLACRFKDRLMFPVLNQRGVPIAFGGRGISPDATPKYLNSPETEIFKKRDTLYGYNLAAKRVSKTSAFIVVEGYMDVVMMNKFGYTTAVASMGTAFSSQHLLKLWKYSDCPIICLDGDSAGYNAMTKIAFLTMPYLQPGKSLKFCRIPRDDDPDSFLRKYGTVEMNKLLAKSENLVDFIWGYFLESLTAIEDKVPENIAKWKKQIRDHVNEIQNQDIKKLYQRNLNQRIADLFDRGNRLILRGNDSERFVVHVDKNEKTLLREAVLLYTLIMHPAMIPAVTEELASIECSNRDFEKLRLQMIESQEFVSLDVFSETVHEIKRVAAKFCACNVMTDDEALVFWRSVFEFGISKERMAEDLRIAKEECEGSLDASTWSRLKALKLDFLNRKNRK